MLTPDQFLAFLAASILITISPGPDNLMVLATGISKGRSRGIAFGLGAGLGCLSHTLLAVVGVSALIAASPMAFTALKLAGGAYLIWLGFRALRSSGKIELNDTATAKGSVASYFFRGIFANAINPKVILFFTAFLPQFIDPGRGLVVQFAVMAGTFVATEVVTETMLASAADRIRPWLGRVGRRFNRACGGLFVAIGAALPLRG